MSHARRIKARGNPAALLGGSTLVAVLIVVAVVLWPFTRQNAAAAGASSSVTPVGTASTAPDAVSGSPTASTASTTPSATLSGTPSGTPGGPSPGGTSAQPGRTPSGSPSRGTSAPGTAPSTPVPASTSSPAAPSAPGTSSALPPSGPAPGQAGSLLWSPDINRGASAFPSVQCASSNTFTTVSDPAKGKVWQAEQPGGQERCEAVGPAVTDGSTYYLGWSSKVYITDGISRYLFQLKCSPSVGTANHPVVLEETGGQIHLEEWTLNHTQVLLWSAPLANNAWHSYALRIHEGRTDGTIQFWFDGVQQTFSTGSNTYTGTTYDGTSDYLKWGVYHPATGTAYQWFTSPRMATSLAVAIAGS
jgi:hypothetical protein